MKNDLENEKVDKKMFDVLIIGGGPAGMTAGLYAVRRGKKVAIIEKFALGGQVNSIVKIENFPSQTLIDGITLSQMLSKQIKTLGVEVIYDDVVPVDLTSDVKVLKGKKAEYAGKSVIIATGLSYVELGIGENEYLGRGVSYCAVCDANFYKNKSVCVASADGSGIKDAIFLSEICSKVTILDSGDLSIFAGANKNKKIDIVSNVKIKKVLGDDIVRSLDVEIAGKAKKIDVDALFVELGKKPQIFGGLKLDNKGFIVTDENMCTSVDGVFAVGDVRSKQLKQIITACGDGAIAGNLA